jgi:hypothetical protein
MLDALIKCYESNFGKFEETELYKKNHEWEEVPWAWFEFGPDGPLTHDANTNGNPIEAHSSSHRADYLEGGEGEGERFVVMTRYDGPDETTLWALGTRVRRIKQSFSDRVPVGTLGTVAFVDERDTTSTYQIDWDLGFNTWSQNEYLELAGDEPDDGFRFLLGWEYNDRLPSDTDWHQKTIQEHLKVCGHYYERENVMGEYYKDGSSNTTVFTGWPDEDGVEDTFAVGDRVEAIKDFDGVVVAGDKGTIRNISTQCSLPYGVEWDRESRNFHSCEGHAAEDHGYWVSESLLKKLSEKAEDPKKDVIRQAMLGSIRKWEGVLEGEDEHGSRDCPLCGKFNSGSCEGCPLFETKPYCHDTPYVAWERHHKKGDHNSMEKHIRCGECRTLATAMLDHIKNRYEELYGEDLTIDEMIQRRMLQWYPGSEGRVERLDYGKPSGRYRPTGAEYNSGIGMLPLDGPEGIGHTNGNYDEIRGGWLPVEVAGEDADPEELVIPQLEQEFNGEMIPIRPHHYDTIPTAHHNCIGTQDTGVHSTPCYQFTDIDYESEEGMEIEDGYLPSEVGGEWVENSDELYELPKLETEFDGRMISLAPAPGLTVHKYHHSGMGMNGFACELTDVYCRDDENEICTGFLPSEVGSVWLDNMDAPDLEQEYDGKMYAVADRSDFYHGNTWSVDSPGDTDDDVGFDRCHWSPSVFTDAFESEAVDGYLPSEAGSEWLENQDEDNSDGFRYIVGSIASGYSGEHLYSDGSTKILKDADGLGMVWENVASFDSFDKVMENAWYNGGMRDEAVILTGYPEEGSTENYRVGDRFEITDADWHLGRKYILARGSKPDRVIAISLSTGNHFSAEVSVEDDHRITHRELLSIFNQRGVKRYQEAGDDE